MGQVSVVEPVFGPEERSMAGPVQDAGPPARQTHSNRSKTYATPGTRPKEVTGKGEGGRGTMYTVGPRLSVADTKYSTSQTSMWVNCKSGGNTRGQMMGLHRWDPAQGPYL